MGKQSQNKGTKVHAPAPPAPPAPPNPPANEMIVQKPENITDEQLDLGNWYLVNRPMRSGDGFLEAELPVNGSQWPNTQLLLSGGYIRKPKTDEELERVRAEALKQFKVDQEYLTPGEASLIQLIIDVERTIANQEAMTSLGDKATRLVELYKEHFEVLDLEPGNERDKFIADIASEIQGIMEFVVQSGKADGQEEGQ